MAKKTINLGTGELTGDGESIRSAFDKINDNFDELYTVEHDLSAIDQSIVPDTDVAYDLGSASNRFRDLYLSGSTIDLGGTTLSVVGGELQLGGVKVTTQTDLNLAANTGDITFTGSTISAADDTSITIQALDEDSVLRSRISLSPDVGAVSMRGYSRESSDTFNTSDWDTANWIAGGGGGQVVIANAAAINDFINDDLGSATGVTFSINGGTAESLGSRSYSGLSQTLTLYTADAPDPDPTTVTEIEFFYSFSSRIGIDYDDGSVSMSARGSMNVSINSERDINLSADDDVRIEGADSFRLINTSTTAPIQIITDDTNNSYTWEFEANGGLTFPDDTVQSTAYPGPQTTLDGDMTGSVFADDSTLLVDGVAGKVVGPVEVSANGSIVFKTDQDPGTWNDGSIETSFYSYLLNFPTNQPAVTAPLIVGWNDYAYIQPFLPTDIGASEATQGFVKRSLELRGGNATETREPGLLLLNGGSNSSAGLYGEVRINSVTGDVKIGNASGTTTISGNTIASGQLTVEESYSSTPTTKYFEVETGAGNNRLLRTGVNMSAFAQEFGPEIDLTSYRSSPANGDAGPGLVLRASTGASANDVIATIKTEVIDTTNGAVNSKLSFTTKTNGSSVTPLTIYGDTVDGSNVDMQGADAVYIGNPSGQVKLYGDVEFNDGTTTFVAANSVDFLCPVDFDGATVTGLPTANNGGVAYQYGYSAHDAVSTAGSDFSVNSTTMSVSLTATNLAQGARIDISGITSNTSAGTGLIYVQRRVNTGSWTVWNAFVVSGGGDHVSHSFVDFYDTGGTTFDVSAGDTVEYKLTNGTDNSNYNGNSSGAVDFELFFGFQFTATEIPVSYSLTQP